MGIDRTPRKTFCRATCNILRITSIVLILIGLFFIATGVSAQEETGNSSTEIVVRRSFTGADVVVALDQSGSMDGYPGFPATDPTGLRAKASKDLIAHKNHMKEEGFFPCFA